MPKLLSEERLRNLFTYDGIWLFPKKQCECDTKHQGYNFQDAYDRKDLPAVKARRQAEFEHFQRRLFPKKQCECDTKHQGYNFQDAYDRKDLPAVKARRQAEFEHFQRREGLPRPPPLLAPPNLPFGYPVHGVEVMPLHTILIPGLRFDGPDASIYKARVLFPASLCTWYPVLRSLPMSPPPSGGWSQILTEPPSRLNIRHESEVILTASLGTLNTLVDIPDSVVWGRGQKQLTISTSDQKLLNFILQHMTYTSTVYQHHKVDMVSLEFKSSVAKFPVTIRHPVIPKLYDPGSEKKLKDLVTIATKTFLRPHKLMTMLKSIREYYPDLTVIVADDSKEPLKINDDYVEYYLMPFGKGWFAGRNLAISQVTTKYVLWVDDDFLFNKKTKIETLVEVLEKTELDVVGGSVLGNLFQFKLLLEQSENGDCLHRRSGSFRPLDGFPNCVVTSGVVNFFLAHTERLRRVGFDPRLQRVAHSEFFIDGLGSLLVGSCSDVIIGHQNHSLLADLKLAAPEKNYSKYRANTHAQVQFKLALHYFKNHLQCST
ncbi:Beta-1,4 N-acetylgalactosaminyltransferase 2 [Pteropus alecto]|uniref:Beta-1,4 N-acetylgalactosaminyltransferase n=1 Tax=Pteropus alecto TaxID=9402 RepID=L5JSA5_PTEAL|nr:Beta-1,4 N-acetylgalactosaminyltransferase 2 [Pteropus alecto]